MKLLFGIFTLGILAILLVVSWYRANLQPVGAGSSDTIMFVVPKGQSVKTILKRLEEDRLIQSAKAAELFLYVSNKKDTLQAGSFRLSPGDSTPSVIEKLKHGMLDVWVTIPEGWRAEQIVDELVKTGYFLDMEKEDLYRQFRAKEGYLFPDTYLFARTATPDQVINKMTDTFEQKVRTVTDQPINAFGPEAHRPLDETHQLILASLIEREAKHDQDRPLVASVLTNRVKIDMALQVDATLQYAKATVARDTCGTRGTCGTSFDWWPQITAADKSIKSPYNTYLYVGLPPGPIANPGLESIKAAMEPAKTDYLYYLSEPDGTTHYAETLQEHNENIRKYLR